MENGDVERSCNPPEDWASFGADLKDAPHRSDTLDKRTTTLRRKLRHGQ
jgi:hypothetical protein